MEQLKKNRHSTKASISILNRKTFCIVYHPVSRKMKNRMKKSLASP